MAATSGSIIKGERKIHLKAKPIKQTKTEKYSNYLDYIKNSGGSPTLEWFDDDWSPIGPFVRDELESLGLAKVIEGRIYAK